MQLSWLWNLKTGLFSKCCHLFIQWLKLGLAVMIMELPFQLQSLRLSIITTSSWKHLTGATEWVLIHVLVTHSEIVEGSGFPLVFLDNPECLATFCTRKESNHPSYTEPCKGTCEEAYNKLWHFSLSYSKRLSKEVRRRFGTSPTLISFPRKNTGQWEEDQHHLIWCSLFSCPGEDFGEDRRDEEEARKRVLFSVHCLQSGLVHPTLLSAVLCL